MLDKPHLATMNMEIEDEDDFYAPEEPKTEPEEEKKPQQLPKAEELEEGEEEDEGAAMDEDDDDSVWQKSSQAHIISTSWTLT